MKPLSFITPVLAALILTACSKAADAPDTSVGLMGEWQSVDDANYLLKFNTETYREFYDNEEVSRDNWQPVTNCDDLQAVEKTAKTYGGFQIWTRETDDRICYAITNWTADSVSLTYAGTTSSYTRMN